MAPPPTAARELRSIDPQIWKACAGTAVTIPTVGSRVYYFPQGHAEQASSEPDFSSVDCSRSYFCCRIAAVRFLANQDTDEVFARISLEPLLPPFCGQVSPETLLPEVPDDRRVEAFGKILTPSDANNGGGFSVPRFCADSIFPRLDLMADTPVQTIFVTDMHGAAWDFRHIYRGTPRRHLLTTGWSKFVNSKKLVAGDSVIFIKNRAGELFVGIRRARRSCGSTPEYLRYAPLIPPSTEAGVKIEDKVGIGQGFSRNVKGRVPPESVVEAVRLAGMNRPFEVVYYPRAGSPDFVVGANIVEAAMRVYWTAGMRVKMSVETEDSSRMTWIQGTASSWMVQDPGLWPGSPWRMLQVTWDEPDIVQNVKSVNPWQVELVPSTTPHIQAPYPNIKKLKCSPYSELPNEGERNMYFPMTGFNSTMMGNIAPSLYSYSTFPAGMQGARHDLTIGSTLSNLFCRNMHQLHSDNLDDKKVSKKLIDVSTELRIGSISPTESSSPQGQGGSIQSYDTGLSGTAVSNPKRTAGGSIQLFGQIIQLKQTFDGDADSFFPYRRKQLLNSLDVQRASALESAL